jgi:hypothetical protein
MSTPAIIQTLDGPIIVTGAQKGQLEAYYLQGASEAVFPAISVTWGNVDPGNRSHPAFADLDNDGTLDMVVGNQRGGLEMYRTEMVTINVPLHTAIPNTPSLNISPNPARAWARVEWSVNTSIRWQAFSMLGQLTAEGESASGSFNVEVRNWKPGIYILKAEAEGVSAMGRLVVVR